MTEPPIVKLMLSGSADATDDVAEQLLRLQARDGVVRLGFLIEAGGQIHSTLAWMQVTEEP